MSYGAMMMEAFALRINPGGTARASLGSDDGACSRGGRRTAALTFPSRAGRSWSSVELTRSKNEERREVDLDEDELVEAELFPLDLDICCCCCVSLVVGFLRVMRGKGLSLAFNARLQDFSIFSDRKRAGSISRGTTSAVFLRVRSLLPRPRRPGGGVASDHWVARSGKEGRNAHREMALAECSGKLNDVEVISGPVTESKEGGRPFKLAVQTQTRTY
jgi:hypothetical protein